MSAMATWARQRPIYGRNELAAGALQEGRAEIFGQRKASRLAGGVGERGGDLVVCKELHDLHGDDLFLIDLTEARVGQRLQ